MRTDKCVQSHNIIVRLSKFLLYFHLYHHSSLSPTRAHSLKTLHKSHLKLNALKCLCCVLKLNKTRHVSVSYLTIFRGYLYSVLYSYYTNTCMFLLYTGYVAIFFLFMCACNLPASAVFLYKRTDFACWTLMNLKECWLLIR